MLDERRARIDRGLILDPVSASAGVRNIARFVTPFIGLGNIPATGSSLVFRVLHPFFNTFWAADEGCSNVRLGNLVMESKITGRFQ